jgi:hypothetical protein
LVRAVHHLFVALCALALLGTGTLPPEHLHHSTATRPQVVHSHFETIRSLGLPELAVSGDDDDHATAIDIDRVMAGGPSLRLAQQPALLPTPVPLSDSQNVATILGSGEPAETPSPPPRPSAPRAPPALP